MTAPDKLISVVIPAYNYAATLPRAVESVLPQLTGECELIVIDDGSTDATPQVLEKLQLAHPGRFRVHRKPNGGLASVRNLGIDLAAGAYLVFLDADDELHVEALQAFADHIRANPDTRFVIGGHVSVQPDGREKRYSPGAVPPEAYQRVKAYLIDKTLSLVNGACCMHREVFSRGRYPEQFRNAEDVPVFAQVLANYPCSRLDAPMAKIHKHDDSLRHDLRYAKQGGVALVDEVFSPARLDESFRDLKKVYHLQRCLSLFRSAYLNGDRSMAREYYRRALASDWRVLFKFSYTRKAIRLALGHR